MNFSDQSWDDDDYFDRVSAALNDGSFFDEQDYRPIYAQMGVNITERVDLIFQDPDFFPPDLQKSAMSALTLLAYKHPNEFILHMACSFPVIWYSGLLDNQIELCREFWSGFILPEGRLGEWAGLLRKSFFKDDQMTSKVSDYSIYLEQGISHAEAMKLIEAEYPRLGLIESPIKYLEELTDPEDRFMFHIKL